MYVARLDAIIGKLPLNGRPLTLNKLRLSDGIFRLKSDSVGTNIVKLIRQLNPDEPKTEQSETMEDPFRFRTKSLELRNFRYVMSLNNAPTVDDQPEGIIYKNMSVSDINLDADRINIKHDTMTFRVNEFSLRERSGLYIRRFVADTGIIRFGKEVTLKGLRFIDNFSDVKMRNLSLLYNGGDDFNDFVNKVNFVVDIYSSSIDFNTLGYFAPTMNRIPAKANVDGQITGHIADFRSDNFALETLNKTKVKCRFSIFGLPNIEKTIIFVDLKHLDTDADDIATVVESMTGKRFAPRQTLTKFGNIHFNGTYTGVISHFVAYGFLRSKLGALEMDLSFNNQENPPQFNGTLAAINFDAGTLLDSPMIGRTGFGVNVHGTMGNNSDIFGDGQVSLFEFNRYKYNNIKLNGNFSNNSFKGQIAINEPNLDLDFNGGINLRGENDLPVFDFNARLRHADLVKLNFNTRDSISSVGANIKANFMASSIFDYNGSLTIDSLTYTDQHSTIDLGTVKLTSYDDATIDSLTLKSDFIDAEYFGQGDLGNFVYRLQDIVKEHIPKLFSVKTKSSPVEKNSNYGFNFHIKDGQDVVRILVPELYVAQDTRFKLVVDTGARLNIAMTSDEISYGDNSIANFRLRCNNDSDSLSVDLSGNVVTPWIAFNNFDLNNSILHDRILTRFSFADSINNSNANIFFATQFLSDPELKGRLLSSINISESELTFFGQRWNLSPTAINIGYRKFNIDGFKINKGDQHIGISGSVSPNHSDSLRLFLDNYNLHGINRYISPFGYQIEGRVSGGIDLYGLYDAPYIISSIQIDTLVANNDTIGNVSLGSMWNNDKESIDITSRIAYNNLLYSSLYGYISPATGDIHADINFKDLKIRIFEPFLYKILSNVSGSLNGDIRIHGTAKNPDISGRLRLENVGVTVDYLQTHYTINSDVDITDSKISINKGQIKDMTGNTGTLSLNLTHNYFRNIKIDASANVVNFLSLNTQSHDNPLFYGTAYTSGVVNLAGTPDQINLAITAETSSDSYFYIPLSSTSQVKESDFLTFVTHRTDTNVKTRKKPEPEPVSTGNSNMKLNFDLAVTPKSEIQILIDPKVGDILRAKGSGNLKMYVDPALGLFNITGDYSIEEGDYNFTLPNFSIVSRKFIINRGSRIRFNGDIANAELDVKASYRERVSLSTLFPDDSLRNHPVECQILITGRMTNPHLKFNVDIHDIDPEKKAQFANLVNTDEKMTRQFLSLLVLRAFMPEQTFASQDLGSSTLMYNASELLSGQIGNLISMFNLPVPLDVNVDYTSNAHNNTGSGFGIDVSTQLFDRVILNGSASNTTTSNRSFVGDIEMEVLLGKNQNTRFKVFSKSRDYFSDDMENNRNGIGLSYRSQFDKWIDLLRRKRKKEKPQQ
jgi:hypothetical protein